MASTFPLNIVTPEKTVLSETVQAVQLPAAGGSLGILAGHAPLLAELSVGECVVRLPNGAQEQLVIAGGFVEVSREQVTVLADTAEFAADIDVNRAEASLARAREMLAKLDAGAAAEMDRATADAEMRRAQAAIRIGGRR
ncbi:MAG: ATP synthase F1 subunit epsilon [Cytophagales bacterium]|nr:ATP synthase F1 subunit epsilon [Armatimonadota bacterium]